MSEVQPTIRLRVFAVATALLFGVLGTMALLGTAHAADGTATPGTAGCATASATKGAPAGTPTADAKCVEVDMFDIYFSPNYITIPADTDITFHLVNKGAAQHDFSVTDHNNKDVKNLNIAQAVDPGKSMDVTVNAPEGVYYFYCNIPGHEQAGMWGMIKVVKDGPITAQSVDDAKKAAGE
jgi:uncharacterized cupredoxin-like copper-binding protein